MEWETLVNGSTYKRIVICPKHHIHPAPKDAGRGVCVVERCPTPVRSAVVEGFWRVFLWLWRAR